jgi:hypothetical protein
MIQLRHDGEPGDTGRGFAALSLHVSDMRDLLTNDGLVHCSNRGPFANIGHDIESGGWYAQWYGGLTSVDEARRLIDDGWAEGATRASAVSDGIPSDQLARPESIRRRIVWGEEGDRLDWERALNGDHDTMWGRSRRRRTSAPRMVSLATSFGGNCSRSAEELFWNGAQMIVTAELLLGAGYQIEVRGLAGNEARGRGVIDITAKDYDAPLRVDMVAALFAHAGVFRTFGFGAICRMPWAVGGGLGRMIDHPADVIEHATEAGWIRPVDVYIPGAYTKDQAVRNIVKAIETVENRKHAAAA